MKARVHKILKKTRVEGPNLRYCIWFQGCSRHCDGCWAKATWDFNGGTEYNVEELLNDILNTPNIDGVTFLGGEPFEQAKVLSFLAENVKKNGLSTVCFTGYKIEELRHKYKEILSNIDLLIDGEFIKEECDYSRPWVGSKNQRYHFLSDRFNPNILLEYKNKIEINVQKNGVIFINGMGDFETFTNNLNMIVRH